MSFFQNNNYLLVFPYIHQDPFASYFQRPNFIIRLLIKNWFVFAIFVIALFLSSGVIFLKIIIKLFVIDYKVGFGKIRQNFITKKYFKNMIKKKLFLFVNFINHVSKLLIVKFLFKLILKILKLLIIWFFLKFNSQKILLF